jgi:hypothetical protein
VSNNDDINNGTPATFRHVFEKAKGMDTPSEDVATLTAGFGKIIARHGNWPSRAEWDEQDASSDSEPASEFEFESSSDAFQIVKDRMQEVETSPEKVKAVVANALARAAEARELKQHRYSDRLMQIAAAVAIEAQVVALGYSKWVDATLVNQVVAANRHLFLEMSSLSSFPRSIPTDVANIIKSVKPLFDDFIIVFTDPKKEVDPKEKDPILFGTLRAFPDRLYYITDWTDPWCDLTLDKFLTIAQTTYPEGWKPPTEVTEVTDADLQQVIMWAKNGDAMALYAAPQKKLSVWRRFGLWVGRLIGTNS